ncbi:MAG: helix-turn-helix transcriptional regulator [Candidatus Hodarchaeota archaeon]
MSKNGMGRVLDRYEIDQRIVEVIATQPDATITVIADETGLSYTAVRNALNRLVTLGIIVETSEAEGPSRRGRPASFFRVERALQILVPPRQFQHLALTLIEQLIQEEGVDHVVGLLDRAAELQVSRLITSWKNTDGLPKTLEQMVKRICEYINQQGCYARHEAFSKGFYIHVHNCIYHSIATAYPGTVCRYHESLISHLIKFHNKSLFIEHEESIAHGAHECRYVVARR